MLLITDVNNLSSDLLSLLKDYSVYNVSSMNMNPNIKKLDIYPTQVMLYDSAVATRNGTIYHLDQMYADILMQDPTKFIQLMTIVRDLYFGKHVILLVYQEEQVFDGLTESLCKFIQQRYGYNYQILNSPEDFNPNDLSSFSVSGIMNFDQDNARFLEYMKQIDPKTFTNENIAAENGWVV